MLVPVLISTIAGWHPDAYNVLRDVARHVAVRARETYGQVRAALAQRQAATVLISNAAYLLAGLRRIV